MYFLSKQIKNKWLVTLPVFFALISIGKSQPIASITAKAQLIGQGISGNATFTQTGTGILIKVEINGATQGNHGIHIHAGGSCEGAGFSNADAHFNPTNKDHGNPNTAIHHAGDLGNIKVDNGVGTFEIQVPLEQLQLKPGVPNSILGKTLIIHEKPDDFQTQPSGNSGIRIACGVISKS